MAAQKKSKHQVSAKSKSAAKSAKPTAKLGAKTAPKSNLKGADSKTANLKKSGSAPIKAASKAPVKIVAKQALQSAAKANAKGTAVSAVKSKISVLTQSVASAVASKTKTQSKSGALLHSATEVARNLKSKAKDAVDSVENSVVKAVEKVSGKANQALRSVEAALDARKVAPAVRGTATVENLSLKLNGALVSDVAADDAADLEATDGTGDDELDSADGEAKTKAKKLQVFRSRAERLKVERLISDSKQPVQKRWAAIHDQLKHLKASAYDMTGQFDLKTPIVHKLLGWGFIVDIRDSRMDVMFKDGLKTLIMNHKR